MEGYFWNQFLKKNSVERPILFVLIMYLFFYFFLPPNFVLAINICFEICRLDSSHMVSYSSCGFKFHPDEQFSL